MKEYQEDLDIRSKLLAEDFVSKEQDLIQNILNKNLEKGNEMLGQQVASYLKIFAAANNLN